MKIISVSNQKGGVGKSTISINLASTLVSLENRVLLIDLDPQGNATTGLGIDKKGYSSYDLLEGRSFNEILRVSACKVDVIPSEVALSTFDVNYFNIKNKEFMLKKALEKVKYDYVIIDCPPTLGLLTVNALVSSNYVLIPVTCEFYSLEGISQMINTIDLIKDNLNSNLKLGGIILNMLDLRLNIQKEISVELKKHFVNKVFKNSINRSVKLVESSSHGVPINLYAKSSNVNKAFENLAKEMVVALND